MTDVYNTFSNEALIRQYAQRGWAIFPCSGKKPLTKDGFKSASTDPKILQEWAKRYPHANIAIATGEISGFFVVDVDVKKGAGGDESLKDLERQFGKLPATVEALTPSGGRHIYFKHPGYKIKCSTGEIRKGIDIRGDGGYVIAPPSKDYVWEAPSHPDEVANAEAPEWLLKIINEDSRKSPVMVPDEIPQGERNSTLTSIAGSMRKRGCTVEAIEAALLVENSRCAPPLSDKEVKKIAESVGQYSTGECGGKMKYKITQGEIITRLCEENIKVYFTTQQGEPFVVLPFEDYVETCLASSKRLRNWLAALYRKKFDNPPNGDSLKQAQIQIEAKCEKSPQIKLSNRVGWHESAIYYDLTTPDWRGVKIDKNDWGVIALPPVFRRYKHQSRQIIPVKGDDPKKLLQFCNIREDDYCLFMVTIATFFIPDVPHVMPYLDGVQGTAKSFTSKCVKGLVDPSAVMLMSTPKDLAHAQMIGDKHWVTAFDNISYIAEWFSDFLCRGITGEGDMKRSLYTDDDEFIRAYRRCFTLNGIGTCAERPDLLDRSIIFGIPDLCVKRSEEDIEAEWKRMLPGILGGFFTAISKAMGAVDQIKGHEAFRMSDYARWGAALAGPLGYSRDEFFKKYQESVNRKWENAADVNTLNGRIVELMRKRDEWMVTFSALLEAVNSQSYRDKNLPDTARKLSSALKRIAPLLHTSGIKVCYTDEREPGTGRNLIILRRCDEQMMGVNVGVNVRECSVNVDDKVDPELF